MPSFCPRSLFLALILLALTCSVQAQSWTLRFDVFQQAESSDTYEEFMPGESAPVPSSTYKVEARLAQGAISVSQSNGVTLAYDFEAKTEATFDAKGKCYAVAPLHYIPQYRQAEFENRIFLSNMLEAGGAASAFGSTFELESLFSIQPEASTTAANIQRRNEANVTTWSCDGAVQVSVSWSDHATVPAELRDSYNKFLLYEFSLHPSIRKAIVAEGKIPQTLSYHQIQVGQRMSFEYSLVESNLAGRAVVRAPKKVKPLRDKNDKLLALIYRTQQQAAAGKFALRDSAKTAALSDQLVAKGAYLDALLALFEYMLQTGSEDIEAVKRVLDAGGDHNWVQAFGFALSQPTTAEGSELALSALNSIPTDSMAYGHLLHIFMGNYAVGTTDDPLAHYYIALEKSPYITGVYKDMGDHYAELYQHKTAWICYDIALHIYPQHPMAISLLALRESIEVEFPEYFE